MIAFPPLAIREDWTPAYLRARKDVNRDFAFNLADPEGAPSRDGRRYHSAVDWFAPGGTQVRSPVDGTVIETEASRGTTGQVFGGVIRIRDASSRVWVLRHVDPLTHLGEVAAGEPVGTVTRWRNGGPHLHLEIWRTLAGGYSHDNMIDPREVLWEADDPSPAYYFEELPGSVPPGAKHRFGPWANAGMRDHTQRRRESKTGRTMRPFYGLGNSLYEEETP